MRAVRKATKSAQYVIHQNVAHPTHLITHPECRAALRWAWMVLQGWLLPGAPLRSTQNKSSDPGTGGPILSWCRMTSPFPWEAIWGVGLLILAVAIGWGVWQRNRRTRAEAQISD